jgi:sucrose-6F-phosphate phosphohydrolase
MKRLGDIKMIKMLVCDFDGTISGGKASLVIEFKQFIERNHALSFVVATGRTLPSICDGLSSGDYPTPTSIISDVGTQLHHGEVLSPDLGWHSKVQQQWDREHLERLLECLPFVGDQNEQHQGEFKLTFEGKLVPSHIDAIHEVLANNNHEVDVTYSHDWFLDITPAGIHKATALSYLLDSHGIKPQEVLVAGDSANDSTMLTLPGVNAVLVGNHYPEVSHLAERPNVYVAKGHHSNGVIEGFEFWQRTHAVC